MPETWTDAVLDPSQEALAYFLKAEKIQPGFWLKNQLNIAKCYLELKDTTAAKKWLSHLVAADALVSDEDREVAAEAKGLLAKM